MEFLGRFVNTTTGIISLEMWYIAAGVLIAAWSFLYLAASIVGGRTTLPVLFGVLISIGIIWLGFCAFYISTDGLNDPIQLSALTVPAALLFSQVLIFIIMFFYRRKQDL